MSNFGRTRAQRMMAKNEDAGAANNNPYASAIYRRFVLPLAEVIREDCSDNKPGRRKAHASLLRSMDPEAVAYLAVRNALNVLVNKQTNTTRIIIDKIGKAAYHELCLSLFADACPKLFYTLVEDLGRKMSKSERHRMTVFKMQAKEAGVDFPEWGVEGVTKIGAYLLDELEALGMLSTTLVTTPGKNGRKPSSVHDTLLSDEVWELISTLKEYVAETTPYFLPCIEQPKPWTAVDEGGFHTKAMRRMMPYAVRSYGSWSELADADMTKPLAAINKLQSVAWRINSRVLDAVRSVARHFDMDEILSVAEVPPPPKPDWLFGEIKAGDMSPSQQEEFINWKRQKSAWFTDMKLRGTKYGRFYTATTVADKFRDFGSIYFVYFADFRGRLYVQTTGVSPQGSDLQKALLHFSTGKALDSLEAERWFCIHGANKWGFDKASLDDRASWHKDKRDQLLAMADDPVANRDWRDADTPLQFLAWVFEYADWVRSPHTFVSRIPVGMDGSCNGLQNFSAMLRDEVGGKATNLVPSDKPSDIYQMVADVTLLRLRQTAPPAIPDDDGTEEGARAHRRAAAEARYRAVWLAHGIGRSLVKRSVMTLPYGSTRFSCADFMCDDYLKLGKVPEFAKEEYQGAAQYLSHFVWDSIGEVVVKAREAMTWLQAASKLILVDGTDRISWTTPSGFKVIQTYQEFVTHRIKTNLCGNCQLTVGKDGALPDKARHKNGIAPNFIHSYDASHLTLVTVAAAVAGIDLAMIHDDYGTHAADAAELYRIIREVFVGMYDSFDPLANFAEAYSLPKPPSHGTLDLRAVLTSPYFFS